VKLLAWKMNVKKKILLCLLIRMSLSNTLNHLLTLF